MFKKKPGLTLEGIIHSYIVSGVHVKLKTTVYGYKRLKVGFRPDVEPQSPRMVADLLVEYVRYRTERCNERDKKVYRELVYTLNNEEWYNNIVSDVVTKVEHERLETARSKAMVDAVNANQTNNPLFMGIVDATTIEEIEHCAHQLTNVFLSELEME